jgi:hypothetical protein
LIRTTSTGKQIRWLSTLVCLLALLPVGLAVLQAVR